MKPSRTKYAAAIAAAALVLTACGGSGTTHATARGATTSSSSTDGSTHASTISRPTTSHPAPPRPTCRGAAAGTTTDKTTIDGIARTVIVHVPAGYSPNHPVALVLDLHGSQSTAAQQELLSGMDTISDAKTFIVAYPQAVIPSGAGFVWKIPREPLVGGAAVPAGAANDETFLVRTVAMLSARYCIDPTRVFATGFSGGARMASQLACDASNTFAAVAAVSGLRLPARCNASRAVSVLAFHGTLDPVDPYNGHGQAYWTYSVPTAARRWAAHDGCAPAPLVTHSSAGVTITRYGRCHGGAVVKLYTLAGEGHEWPGGPKLPRAVTRVLGPQTNAVDANILIWYFFTAHPRP